MDERELNNTLPSLVDNRVYRWLFICIREIEGLQGESACKQPWGKKIAFKPSLSISQNNITLFSASAKSSLTVEMFIIKKHLMVNIHIFNTKLVQIKILNCI
jgi:hypothetical protein